MTSYEFSNHDAVIMLVKTIGPRLVHLLRRAYSASCNDNTASFQNQARGSNKRNTKIITSPELITPLRSKEIAGASVFFPAEF